MQCFSLFPRKSDKCNLPLPSEEIIRSASSVLGHPIGLLIRALNKVPTDLSSITVAVLTACDKLKVQVIYILSAHEINLNLLQITWISLYSPLRLSFHITREYREPSTDNGYESRLLARPCAWVCTVAAPLPATVISRVLISTRRTIILTLIYWTLKIGHGPF